MACDEIQLGILVKIRTILALKSRLRKLIQEKSKENLWFWCLVRTVGKLQSN